jgi:S1-C subfamily serine protease
VAVYGYPLSGVLSSSGNIVAGYVTSLAGIGDDTRFFQISAPIQPGDSGGAVLDQYGAVIGVVHSIYNPEVAMQQGFTPQQIGFATKTSVLVTFLEANSIAAETVASDLTSAKRLELTELVDLAKKFTVLIECK